MELSSSVNRTAGYRLNGNTVTGEIRQCNHCGTTWDYVPGSGIERGVCLKCMKLVCGAPACISGHCAPVNAILQGGDTSYVMNAAGIMVKR